MRTALMVLALSCVLYGQGSAPAIVGGGGGVLPDAMGGMGGSETVDRGAGTVVSALGETRGVDVLMGLTDEAGVLVLDFVWPVEGAPDVHVRMIGDVALASIPGVFDWTVVDLDDLPGAQHAATAGTSACWDMPPMLLPDLTLVDPPPMVFALAGSGESLGSAAASVRQQVDAAVEAGAEHLPMSECMGGDDEGVGLP